MKNIINKVISDAINSYTTDFDLIEVTTPKKKENGNYSTNIALKLVKILNKNPLEIANSIIEKIELNDIIIDVKVEKPGFINFFISNKYLLDNINTIIEQNSNYGKNTLGNNKSVNIEFVSANPTGYLHLGHARSAFYGSALANVLKYSNYNVTREYYINDAGNQINNLELSVKLRYDELCGIDINLEELKYHGLEIKTIAKEIYEIHKDTLTNDDMEIFKDFSVKYLLNKIKIDLENIDVIFDQWTSEKSIYESNEVNKTIELLHQNNQTYIQDMATYIKTSNYFDDKDRVIIKNNNEFTYLLPDIAYHINKYNRGFDILIDVLGADHHGYIPRLKSSIEMLNYDSSKLEVKILQLVKLIKNNEEVKMSKRSGNAITINDLVEMIGLRAAKYFMVSKSLDSKMDLDIDIMTKQSNDNPIYYIEYAYARICSILDNKELKQIDNYTTITKDESFDLLKKLYEFNEIIISATSKREIHLIPNYLYNLASLFHSYYNSEKFITDDLKYTNERLNLLKATQIVIKNGLNLINIEPRERM